MDPIKYVGHVTKVQGLLIESRGPQAVIGEQCRIEAPRSRLIIPAEVVGLRDEIVQLMPYSETEGIEVGSKVIASCKRLEIPVSKKLLGRVLDCTGRPLDDKGEVASSTVGISAGGLTASWPVIASHHMIPRHIVASHAYSRLSKEWTTWPLENARHWCSWR